MENLQKERMIQKLKDHGYRITRQRLMLLDIILEEDCSCCKEIYYKASRKDAKIGTATVYRMVNMLEEIGAIRRENMYKVACDDKKDGESGKAYIVELDDHTEIELSEKNWNRIIQTGLSACGYVSGHDVKKIRTSP